MQKDDAMQLVLMDIVGSVQLTMIVRKEKYAIKLMHQLDCVAHVITEIPGSLRRSPARLAIPPHVTGARSAPS
jgi:hypothetical protein